MERHDGKSARTFFAADGVDGAGNFVGAGHKDEHIAFGPALDRFFKGIGGGFPLGAVLATENAASGMVAGTHGSTYGGNPLGIAAAHAVLDVIEEEQLCDRANTLGSHLKQRLESLRGDIPEIVDIRGLGFMNAVEFNQAGTDIPNADFANGVRANALERGLILLTCGVYGNVIRFLAPITVQDNVFSEALDILEASIRATKDGN